MTDRSIRATGLIALALSCCVLLYAWSLVDQSRRAVAVAAASLDRLQMIMDRQEREYAEYRATLDRMLEAERDRARRAGRAPWRERID
jgi:methylase of polypeptide subunit release factors